MYFFSFFSQKYLHQIVDRLPGAAYNRFTTDRENRRFAFTDAESVFSLFLFREEKHMGEGFAKVL